MELYRKKYKWKVYLIAFGLSIVALSAVFSIYLTRQLAAEERKKVDTYVLAQEMLNDPNQKADQDITLYLKILQSNTSIPVILVDDRDNIIAARNFSETKDTNEVFLRKQLEHLRQNGEPPIKGFAYEVYYKNSKILTLLQWFPFVQLLLIGGFVTYGYVAFSSARKAEQNQVWVGMAKETAHQLGTPITAIISWLEHLKLLENMDAEGQEIIMELGNDVGRLELIAHRFSKIGSKPELFHRNLHEELGRCKEYMSKRSPRKVSYDFPEPGHPIWVNINPPLFDWVIENLIRNALDAMEGKGIISAHLQVKNQFVYIDISDTGKGIPASKFKTVFKPGYSTKKRGWGLGLSLAKRIIETYHRGKIFVKKSFMDKGTTFTIRLPISEESATP